MSSPSLEFYPFDGSLLFFRHQGPSSWHHRGERSEDRQAEVTMPLFEYHCDNCDETFEVIRRASDEDEVTCPKCDSKARKQLSWFAMGSSGSRGCAPGSGGSWGGG
jgi:putative FmdB family regulatory protein